ncbi:Endonuclease/exonuclease/phosphatase [Cristinia sonorae]|uniref:Endonuclease/exonuclease/phosphatase n=1 Tax=Cristinia sonorae TaxID=1940300 RepID=A0A8K0URR9_9AGAR|nr:Endonuclease/exonuclease/phosphatase [Cristinia sonorae]
MSKLEVNNALAEERRLKKLQNQERARQEDEARSRILPRKWIDLSQSQPPLKENRRCKVMTWNLLAQCLVRRTLFPTSDCLKASEREHMLYREILEHKADICCLQEVDRTEKVFPVLDKAGYGHVHVAGPLKKHGCTIAFRREILDRYAEKRILYDEQEIRQTGKGDLAKRGISFRTKNVANLVALKWKDCEDDGVIVATTHLFWHPSYTYERARQAAILLREVTRFRHGLGKESWPCIIAGDFNFAPDDPAYSILVGDPLLPQQSSRLSASRVVHVTIDPEVPVTTKKMMADDEGDGDGETDPDRIIVNARRAGDDDGLLTDEELREICVSAGQPFSAYDRGLQRAEAINPALLFGSRVSIPQGRRGAAEPIWTSYTHFWKVVLDYIFVVDPDRNADVVGVASPHPTENLKPGLPRKGVCASDHISLCADLTWSNNSSSVV